MLQAASLLLCIQFDSLLSQIKSTTVASPATLIVEFRIETRQKPVSGTEQCNAIILAKSEVYLLRCVNRKCPLHSNKDQSMN